MLTSKPVPILHRAHVRTLHAWHALTDVEMQPKYTLGVRKPRSTNKGRSLHMLRVTINKRLQFNTNKNQHKQEPPQTRSKTNRSQHKQDLFEQNLYLNKIYLHTIQQRHINTHARTRQWRC
jgi:hypothetical protein